jgi:hypothetical protein
MAPLPPVRGERRCQVEQHDHPALAEDAPQRSQKFRVSGIAGRITVRTIAAAVANRHRLDLTAGIDHRLEQRAMKRQQYATVAGRAGRKDRDHVARCQCRANVTAEPMRIAAPATLDEQRADAGDQSTEQRPVREIRLGDEARRLDGVDDEYIEPRNMVGDDQHVADEPARRPSSDTQLGAEDRQQRGAPAAYQCLAARRSDQRKDQRGCRKTLEDMKAESQQALTAARQWRRYAGGPRGVPSYQSEPPKCTS